MGSTARKTEAVVPLVCNRIEIPQSMIAFSAACFKGSDWSLSPLQRPDDTQDNPELAHRIETALRVLGGRSAYAPNPTKFNARIIRPENLDRAILLPGGVFLFRNQDHPADGTFLENRGDAGIFSAAGCSVIVATYRGKVIFAHAGRDCALDRKRVETNGVERGRIHESVVDAILESFDVLTAEELRGVRIWVFYSIKPEDFAHRFADKQHHIYNIAAAQYVPRHFGQEASKVDAVAIYIDVPRIIKAQAVLRGIPEENISLEHAYLADELPHTRKGTGNGRYLVAIVRH